MKRVAFSVFTFVSIAFLAVTVAAAQSATISSQPQSLTVNSGSTAAFSVSANNAVSYQWQFKGANVSGATASALNLENVQDTQAGDYNVIVYDGDGGSVASQTATLTVVPGTLLRFYIAPGGNFAGGEIQVRLFDHDKPATVQNFLHYVTDGDYADVIFHRLDPGFVLQGGGYAFGHGSNKFAYASGTTNSIQYYWVDTFHDTNGVLPWALNNEFGIGPRVSNTFGTLAMAKLPNDPNSATCQWFFNLGNNSTNLDTQNGGFTVFGRVVGGEDVLSYFNSLSKPTNGICDVTQFPASSSSLADFANLPVRFAGTNYPAFDDLFHCDISLLSPTYLDHVPPSAPAVLYPSSGALLTNGFLAQGTASDDVGLARIIWVVYNDQVTWSGNATGTTNWSQELGLPPGQYWLQLKAQDGWGNITVNEPRQISVSTILHVVAQGPGKVTSGLDGILLGTTNTYSLAATPRTGALFCSWSDGKTTLLNPKVYFQSSNSGLNFTSNGLTLTATFISNNLPRCIAFTYPSANAKLTNESFTLRGSFVHNVPVSRVSCEFFSSSSSVRVGSAMEAQVTTNGWSVSANLAPGAYIVYATAYDAQGRTTRISENFSVLARMSVQTFGPGVVTPNYDGKYLEIGKLYAMTAVPNRGQFFAEWFNPDYGARYNSTVSFYMFDGFTLSATFATNYFPNVQGVYQGLFYPDVLSATNSGYFTLKTTPSGAYSGRLSTFGKTYPFSGQFSIAGGGAFSVRPADKISVGMTLDLTNGTESLVGRVSTSNWVAQLTSYRSVAKLSTNTVPRIGKYTVSLPGDKSATNQPAGDGFGTLSFSAANAATLTGTLADNLPFAQPVAVAKDGSWPVYSSFANGQGVLIGWEKSSAPTRFGGGLSWIKPASAKNTFYTNGFTATVNSTGNAYTPPVPGAVYRITLNGGTLAQPLTSSVTVNASHQFVVPANSAISKLKLSLASNGVISGSFLNAGKTLSFKGVFSSPDQGGSGFIVDQNRETGSFVISPAP